jgi:diphthine synthase
MGELWFVGLGLADERGLSERAREVLRGAGAVFAEQYTAVPPVGTFERLGQFLGRPVTVLDRPLLESERPIVEALDRFGSVALVVPGDPFAATTHVALRLAAERAGHRWRYLPAASVLTAAAGFLGLMHYRFGRTVSLPFPAPGFEPTSPLDQIAANRTSGLHTLVLLDLRPDEGRFLTAGEGLRALRARDPGGRAVPTSAPVGVVARVGRDDPGAWWAPLETLVEIDFGAPMHTVIVPAPDLHFEEEAAVRRFRWPRGA